MGRKRWWREEKILISQLNLKINAWPGWTNQTRPHAVSHVEFKGWHLLLKDSSKLHLQLRSWNSDIQGVQACEVFNNAAQVSVAHRQTDKYLHADSVMRSIGGWEHSEVFSQRTGGNNELLIPSAPGLKLFCCGCVYTHKTSEEEVKHSWLWSDPWSCVDLWCRASLQVLQARGRSMSWVVLTMNLIKKQSRRLSLICWLTV